MLFDELLNYNKKDKTTNKINEQKDELSEFQKYLNMVNPETNKPYIIPLLSMDDPQYAEKYVSYMKMKEESPEAFNMILNWE